MMQPMLDQWRRRPREVVAESRGIDHERAEAGSRWRTMQTTSAQGATGWLMICSGAGWALVVVFGWLNPFQADLFSRWLDLGRELVDRSLPGRATLEAAADPRACPRGRCAGDGHQPAGRRRHRNPDGRPRVLVDRGAGARISATTARAAGCANTTAACRRWLWQSPGRPCWARSSAWSVRSGGVKRPSRGGRSDEADPTQL